jgi:putative transcriptional regulator
METETSLSDHFLIAMPSLADPNFSRTVTYLCDHNDQGAMGLVINRRLEITLSDILQHVGISDGDPDRANRIPVFQGGPVQMERGFVLHQPLGSWEATLPVTDEIGITMSRDIIEAIARGEPLDHYLIALGYAGWGSGQLENEMAANAWLSGPADPDILFEKPVDDRWSLSAAHLGVDLSLLSSDIGHA